MFLQAFSVFCGFLYFFTLLRVYPYPGAALGVKAYIWKLFAFSHFSCKIHSLKGVLFPSFPLKLEIEIQISISKLLPEGSGFEMEIQIQTRLINAIWGPKSENSARMPIAYSPGGARGPRRGPIAFSRGQAGQRFCDYPIPWRLPFHRGSTLGLLNCFTARAALGSAASAVCAASSRGLEHYVKATATGDRHLAIGNGLYIYIYIYIYR